MIISVKSCNEEPDGKVARIQLDHGRSLLRFIRGFGLVSFLLLVAPPLLLPCTIFTLSRGGKVLVGNNEDWSDKQTRMWFIPGTRDTFGVVYFGFKNLFPQGGMNERGLFFDANALPHKDVVQGKGLPRYNGDLMDHVMRTCSTVQEAIKEISSYDFSQVFAVAQFHLADRTGDAAVLEGDAIIRKSGDFIISTNFRQYGSSYIFIESQVQPRDHISGYPGQLHML
jgi:penicillin V acylase-like amidase (Ntn superfamily)